ncbi:DUF695 domain-containing protein [Mucilaginibacter pedocola]|uniref:DUF695 domain-containing protein n=1 Tax=Mucilaginibacter pedocola TaxID=1792845 RepID=A0A1S9P845_9SPHI|nr:DUF695 domain-containing protein [Mucilaginibacter pedocola]OOQ57109.1 DUF695 domain-containing protein [Mucilaginibacter pedocola]
MNFLKNLFNKKDKPIKTYHEFWEWFVANERKFFAAVQKRDAIEAEFFNALSAKLGELRSGYFYLAGMPSEDLVDLTFTADGNIKNMVFVEELVNAAPRIEGWEFTALKPPIDDIGGMYISMGGEKFSSENIFFYADDDADCPDEINIKVVHADMDENNKDTIINGTYIFLDNFLGELRFATTVDNLTVIGKVDAEQELVPIEKLKTFLIWREKEFIEKYEGVRHDTEQDTYSALEATLENGNPLVAIINTDLLRWDARASHPWVAAMEIKYNGQNNNGMPDNPTYQLLNQIEEGIMAELKDIDGYLNIGRQTADNSREVYFACKDFRKPSKVLDAVVQQYAGKLAISFDIYKDKYWQTFNRFMP